MVRADCAALLVGQVIADSTVSDVLFHVGNSLRQTHRLIRRRFEKMKRHALGAARADARQFRQLVDQSLDRLGMRSSARRLRALGVGFGIRISQRLFLVAAVDQINPANPPGGIGSPISLAAPAISSSAM